MPEEDKNINSADNIDIKSEESEKDNDKFVDSLEKGNNNSNIPNAKSTEDSNTGKVEITAGVDEQISELSNTETDKAVDKIVSEESDELMEAQDKERERQFAPPETKKGMFTKIKSVIHAWWDNKVLRYSTFVALAIFLTALIFIPTTRYLALNTFGVRVSSSITVVDSQTGLPLKNIPVKLQNQELRSDDEGNVNFSNLKLGNSDLAIDKLGYAEYTKDITLGWGSNPLGPQPLVATGTQFVFNLTDWLGGEPVTNAEATSGEDTAKSDDNGKITLTVGEFNQDSIATIVAEGYRDELIKLSELAQQELEVKMVPAKKHPFVSNRSGKYDLYKIDVDGKNEEVLLAATGEEREVPYVLPSQESNFAAFVSSRDAEQNKDGFILDGLFIIDLINGKTDKVTRSEQLEVVGWIGNKLLYVAVVEGVSAENPERSKIFSYDIDTKERIELASSNYFNDVKLVQDRVYYAISGFGVPASKAKTFSIDASGNEEKNEVDTQTWSIIRADFETIVFNAINQQWFEQKIDQTAIKLEQEPAKKTNRNYVTSPDKKLAAWTDIRDGKGVLLSYNIEDKTDDVLLTHSGLDNPIYWVNDSYIIYRISNSQESADYIYNSISGDTNKISDVVGNRSRYFY